MKELTQVYTDLGARPFGDCLRTAVACLLDRDRPEDVPHFVEFAQQYDDIGETYDWWRALRIWVRHHVSDSDLACYDEEQVSWPIYVEPGVSPAHVILIGRSPRDATATHAVVGDGLTGEIAWDVHPDRSGLAVGERQILAIVPRYPLEIP